MSRHPVTCLPEEYLPIGSYQVPPQVPSPTETGAIRIVWTIQAALSTRYELDSAEECNQDTFAPHRVRQESAILSPRRVGLPSALKRHSIPSKSVILSPKQSWSTISPEKVGYPQKILIFPSGVYRYSPASVKSIPDSLNIPQRNIRMFPGRMQGTPNGAISPAQSKKVSPIENWIILPSRFWKLVPCRIQMHLLSQIQRLSPQESNWVILSKLQLKYHPQRSSFYPQ